MKTLVITASTFFAVCGILAVHFLTQAPSYEYDMNYVIPIDASKMPRSILPLPVVPVVQSEISVDPSAGESRAEAPATGSDAAQPQRAPFRFDGWRTSTPDEAKAAE